MNLINTNSSEIAKIVHDYIERDIGNKYDLFNSPPPPIYIGPVKVKSLKERLEETKMKKATSVQNIKNVNGISFLIENNPMEEESKFTIVASTDDDIFEFEFEGPDLLQSCKAAGLFTVLEKCREIKELKEENKPKCENCLAGASYEEMYRNLRERMKKEYEEKIKELEKELGECLKTGDEIRREKNRKINELNQQLHKAEHDKKGLTWKNEQLEQENENLKKELALEKAANEAQRKFIQSYAGKGTEVQFNYAIDEAKEVSYDIVDKEKYEALKNCDCKVRLHGMDFTPDELVDIIRELEELKTPTIENFADKEPTSRRDILKAAEMCVCGKREQDYGTPESNFQLIADLWNDYLGFTDPGDKIQAKDVAMMMALMKIARIRNGGGSGDSFVDLAGYAACGGEIWYGGKTQVPEGE